MSNQRMEENISHSIWTFRVQDVVMWEMNRSISVIVGVLKRLNDRLRVWYDSRVVSCISK